MASPVSEGTFSSSAFSSRNMDILKEQIFLKIDRDFRHATYRIEYFIRTDSGVAGVPMLFHAKNYKDDFRVWVDGIEVQINDIPQDLRSTANTPFEVFSDYFDRSTRPGDPESVVIHWEEHVGSVYELNDLKYFEADLSRGEHVVRVEYTSLVWSDRSDWVKEYRFPYSLSPAKHWRSFGSLEIILDARDFDSGLKTNLGKPMSGSTDSMAVWRFSELPADYFEIIHTPVLKPTAKLLTAIGPLGLTIFMGIIWVLLHYALLRLYRKRYPHARYSWVLISGSILIPLIVLIGFMASFSLIDLVIGEEAGRYHGYTFMVIILYPLILPVYWWLMWLADKGIKKRMAEMNEPSDGMGT